MKYDAKIIEWIADDMCNYQVLTDEEFIDWLIEAYEITHREAEFIMGTRDQFLRTAVMPEDTAFEIVADAIERANSTDETVEGNAPDKRNKNTIMEITRENYFGEYAKLSKDQKTENFEKTHNMLSMLTKSGNDWTKVKGNKTFSDMAAKQFQYLAMILQKTRGKSAEESAPATKVKPATQKVAVKPKHPKTEARQPNAKETAQRIRKSTAKITSGNPVETVDPHLVILMRYKRMDGKTVARERVSGLARTLVKQIEARILRKASSYSKLIEKMREHLFEVIEKSKGANVRFSIPGKLKSEIEKVIDDEHQMKSVQLLRRYAGIAGKHSSIDKAKRLYNSMVTAIEKEHVPQDDRYFERVIEVMRHLKKYIEHGDERKQLQLLPAELSGVLGCACSPDDDQSLEGISENEEADYSEIDEDEEIPSVANSEQPVCSTDFMHRKFARYPIGEPWVRIFGQIEPGKHSIVFSKEKLGKTTAMVDFAGYLSKQHGPVLFVQKEEGLSGTFQDKLETTRAANPNLFLKEELPPIEELKQYRFVFLDSVSRLNLSPQQLFALQRKLGKHTTVIAILHATKDGKHRGANDYAHDASQIVTFPEYGAAYGYGRFKGTTGELVRFTDPKE